MGFDPQPSEKAKRLGNSLPQAAAGVEAILIDPSARRAFKQQKTVSLLNATLADGVISCAICSFGN